MMVALLCVVLFFLVLLGCSIGPADISFFKAIRLLAEKIPFLQDFLSGGQTTETDSFILFQVRLPRIVMSLFAGAVLSLCGATYQAVFRNPLTEPYILGVSSGASLGAAIAIVLGMENSFLGISGLALLMALLGVFFIYRVASTGKRLHTATLLLAGVSVNFLCAAIIAFLIVLQKEKMEKIIFWTMGSFSAASWSQIGIIVPLVIVGSVIILFCSKQLNILLAGDETAKSLGVETEKLKKLLLLISTLMVAMMVSCCGVIGFVGLVVPHIVRILFGADNRVVLPYSIFFGAIFMFLADTFARTVLQPSELPVGSITALIGAPYFIYLLYKAKKQF